MKLIEVTPFLYRLVKKIVKNLEKKENKAKKNLQAFD